LTKKASDEISPVIQTKHFDEKVLKYLKKNDANREGDTDDDDSQDDQSSYVASEVNDGKIILEDDDEDDE
jgi:hypothetical protein